MGQGVIKPFKTQYGKVKVLQMLQSIENGADTKNLTILIAVLMISESEKFTQTTITKVGQSSTVEDDNAPFFNWLLSYTYLLLQNQGLT